LYFSAVYFLKWCERYRFFCMVLETASKYLGF
jgi:hypothetical protein